ncbi:hypothetical protein BSKO_10236 [Bryopsis sp. KO-2023]|nr:hypothetical protein BSKO_10236 [Bryopsis sp. KO-2023]
MGSVPAFQFSSDGARASKPRRHTKGRTPAYGETLSPVFGNKKETQTQTEEVLIRRRKLVRPPVAADVPIPLKSQEAPKWWGELPDDIAVLLVAIVKSMGNGSGATLKAMRLVNKHWKTAINQTVNSLTCSALDPSEPFRLAQRFPCVTALNLREVNLAGIAGLSAMPNLRSLNLWGTKLGEDEVKLLSELKHLRSLEVGWIRCNVNAFQPFVWHELRHLTSLTDLTSLDLSELSVYGPDLQSLSSLKQLRTLRVGSICRAGDDDECDLSHFSNLTSCHVGNARVNPKELTELNLRFARGVKVGRCD